MKIAHIINPIKVSENFDLLRAQSITIESMEIAKKFSKFKDDIILCSTQFEEDLSAVPSSFKTLSNLKKSVLDYNANLKNKKLPLIKDILEKLRELTEAEYYIYTNIDIAVMPYFYDFIFNAISNGNDAIVINRRRLKINYLKSTSITEMYSDLGKSHPGFDCFVFHKDLLNKFILSEICIGIPFVETTLVHNIFSFAKNPIFIPDAHLTFHIGMNVLGFTKNDFYEHNKSNFFNKIQPQLKQYYNLKKFPYGALPIHKRCIKWVLNPSLFTKNYLELEGKNTFQKIKLYLDEIRWRILQK